MTKKSKIIVPFIFVSDSEVSPTKNNSYFAVGADGFIRPKDNLDHEHNIQVEAFINILNLNHIILKEKRVKDVLDGIIDASRSVPTPQKNTYWKNQFRRISANKSQPFRQFLLIFILGKLGVN